ncbi:DUF917 family protein [Streptomyces iconiensis]|uniref:DUF917 family protein n=1 Tax=Streptomyces iconiensis TaxID=1384038 RepID=A0ABT6ZQK9_9ACTN|nr:DUF917 family protein [Streptomyces iconiensis]MDJ1131335.1 DUF917 family protein [Streptomyces iconiensis]
MTPARIGPEELEHLASGALVLAAGAEPSSFRTVLDLARAAVRDRGPVPLIPVEGAGAGRLCVAVSLVGSSTALAERLPLGAEPVRAVRALERRLGRRAEALVPLNMAAENALLSFVCAAGSGLPLVDGDGCGRVLPLLEQTTFTLAGVEAAPLALATPAGDVVVIEAAGSRIEELVRPLVLAAGGWAVAACYAMDGTALAASAVPGTVTRALAAGARGTHTQLGDAGGSNIGSRNTGSGNIRSRTTGGKNTAGKNTASRTAGGAKAEGTHVPATHARGTDALFEPWGARRLCRGRIVGVEHPGGGAEPQEQPEALPSRPTSVVVAETEGLERRVRLEAHNEVLLALADGAPVAAVPDQILMVSPADGRVLDVERARPGIEVEVVVIPAAPAWRTPEGRRLARGGGLGPLSPVAQEEP